MSAVEQDKIIVQDNANGIHATINNPFRQFGSTGEGVEHARQGARQRQPAGDLRAPPRRGTHPVRGPGKSSIILTDNAEQPDD